MSDEVDQWTGAILVQGVGPAAESVEVALEDVTRQQPWYPLAFVVCDPDSRNAVTSATWIAKSLQDVETLTVGVALGPCGEYFSEAVDLLIRLPAAEAAAVLRPLVGVTAGFAHIPFDVSDLRGLFGGGGEAIAERRAGITTMAALSDAMDETIAATRNRGALTDDRDWLLFVFRHGPTFGVGTSTAIVTGGAHEPKERPMLFGTFCDQHYGDQGELIALARVCHGA
jgi:hypothetical protein